MALKKCPECGKEITSNVTECPGCGCPIISDTNKNTINSNEKKEETIQKKSEQTRIKNVRKKSRNKYIILGLVIVIASIIFFVKMTGKDSSTGETVPIDSPEIENNEKENSELNVKLEWEDGEAPTTIGDSISNAKILDSKIVDSSYGALLVIDFEYTNNSEEAENFINDSNCSVEVYQNGVALNKPGSTSEPEKYDFNEAFTSVKKGGVIKTQLAWILSDTVNSIEIDFGMNEKYQPDYSKKINLSGGKKSEDSADSATELTKSDYTIVWNNEPIEVIGDSNEQAIIKKVAIIDSVDYGMLLIMDIDFINNLDKARNLINDSKCRIVPYQNGIELETPGTTSNSEEFNYSDAFTLVKKGGKISTQLVWVLRDNNPIEIEFGLDEHYKPINTETITFKK